MRKTKFKLDLPDIEIDIAEALDEIGAEACANHFSDELFDHLSPDDMLEHVGADGAKNYFNLQDKEDE